MYISVLERLQIPAKIYVYLLIVRLHVACAQLTTHERVVYHYHDDNVIIIVVIRIKVNSENSTYGAAARNTKFLNRFYCRTHTTNAYVH